MEYQFASNDNYEDFAAGRVLYSRPGATNFPVRLAQEIFGRCLSHSVKKTGLTIYDPCCGSAYLLAVVAFQHHDAVDRVVGSDSDATALETARKNLALLSSGGLDHRRWELSGLAERYGKRSHVEAIGSVDRLARLLVPGKETEVEVFQHDASIGCASVQPDIVLCDLPYGKLTQWSGPFGAGGFLEGLALAAGPQTVVAVVHARQARLDLGPFRFLERHQIGKRKFALLALGN